MNELKNGIQDSGPFTLKDLESMTPTQLSKLTLVMLKESQWSPGSYSLSPKLFDLIEYLDGTVSIPEDPHLEKFLHMTASLVCLTQFQGKIKFNSVQPERLAKHLERIIGPPPWEVPSLETEPSP